MACRYSTNSTQYTDLARSLEIKASSTQRHSDLLFFGSLSQEDSMPSRCPDPCVALLDYRPRTRVSIKRNSSALETAASRTERCLASHHLHGASASMRVTKKETWNLWRFSPKTPTREKRGTGRARLFIGSSDDLCDSRFISRRLKLVETSSVGDALKFPHFQDCRV